MEWERDIVTERSAFLLVIVFCLGLTGCATSQRRGRPPRAFSEHLLFNPEWTGLVSHDVQRSDWPSTPAFAHGSEYVEYRETIIDRQGDFGFASDRLYRRFDSVRRGKRWQR